MAKQLFANNVSTPIIEHLTASDTTITVSSTSRFPAISGGDWIMATIVPQGGQGTPEIVKITAFSGANVTVVRGQEGTAAQDFQFGSLMELRVTKGTLEELRDFTQTGTGATLRTKVQKLQDFITPADFGAVGDGVTDDRAALALADAETPLLITKNHRISSNITISNPVVFLGNGRLTIDSGITVTFTTQPRASEKQIFFSTGLVAGLSSASVKWFGATGDGVTNDYTAFNRCKDSCVLSGAEMHIPAGDYLWDLTSVGTALWDVTRTVRGAKRAFPIIGAGLGQTAIHITNATSIAWQLATTIDWFDLTLRDFTVYGSFNFPLLVLGKNDFSDPINMVSISNVSVENSNTGSSNEAVRMNYITGGIATNLRCNSFSNGAGTNTGVALRLRQVEFMTFLGGSAGNADRGVDFTDGTSFGCFFASQTYENSDYCFSNRSANSGAHTVIGGQFSNVGTFPIFSSAFLTGEPLTFIGSNYTPAGALVDPANYQGVRIVHNRGVTTPAVPASTVSTTNATGVPILVYIWGGTVTAITIDGFSFGLTSGTFVLQPGSAISVTYTVVPTWEWKNMQA